MAVGGVGDSKNSRAYACAIAYSKTVTIDEAILIGEALAGNEVVAHNQIDSWREILPQGRAVAARDNRTLTAATQSFRKRRALDCALSRFRANIALFS